MLPVDFALALARLRGERLNTTLRVAREVGWPLNYLAGALGVSYQRVNQRIAKAYNPSATSIPVPTPPPSMRRRKY